MPKYESIKEIMENGYKYLADALEITEDEAMQFRFVIRGTVSPKNHS